MMENIIIRVATENDVAPIAKMLFELKKQYGSCSENDEFQFYHNYYNSILFAITSSSNFIWIGEVKGNAVGFISYTKRHVLRLNGSLINMEELFVLKEFRRIGVAYSLYNESISYFKDLGISNLEVVSSLAHPGQKGWSKKIGLEWYSNIHRRTI